MDVLLCWKMPRAYKVALACQFAKLMWRGITVGVVCVSMLGGIALSYLSRIDASEATRVMPIVFVVALYLPANLCLALLTLVIPTYYKLTQRELKKGGDHVCWWNEVESYTFEPCKMAQGLHVLKFKVRARKGKRGRAHEWAFNPDEVDQALVAQIFEKQIALHRE